MISQQSIRFGAARITAGTIVGAASLALALFCVVALVRYVHVPEHFNGDVVGWIVVNHYSKLQEQINYFGALAIVAIIGAANSFGVARFARAIDLRFELGSHRALLAGALALVPAPLAFFFGMPYASLFLHPLTYLLASLALITISSIMVWRMLLVMGSALRPASLEFSTVEEPASPPARVTKAVAAGRRRLLSVAIVLLLGCYCGWFLPVLLSFAPGLAAFMASVWLVFPIAFVVAYIRLAFVVSEDVAILAFAPASLLVLFPPLLEHRRSTFLLGAVVAVGSAVAVSFVLRRSGKLRVPSVGVLAAWLTVLGGFVYPWVIYSYNPHLLHGINIGPVDGDNQQAWLHDATLGRLPYKNFGFPYGPLQFYFQFVFVHFFGLDRFGTPFAMASGFFAFVIAAFTSSILFVHSWVALIAAPVTLLAFGYELRVLTAYLALVSSMQAFAKSGRWAPLVAGLTWGIAIIFALEFAIIAAVAAVALAIYVLAELRKSYRFRQSMPPLTWIAVGAAVVIVPSLILLYAAGMLGPYIVSFTSFLGVVDQCCDVPFAPLLDSAGLVLPAQGGFLYLLDAPTFQMYYMPPVIYSVAIVYVIVRRMFGGMLPLKDRYLLGVLVFGVLAFRYALGRSDGWHVSNSALAALILALMFGERLIIAAWASVRNLFRERSISLLALNVGAVAATVWLLFLIARVLGFNTAVFSKIEPYAASLAGYYKAAYAAPTDRVAGNDVWKAVLGPQDQQYLFREPDADNLVATLQYLRMHLRPGERVYGVPYAARYEVLLDLPTPINFGPEIWSEAVRPSDERLWVSEIDAAKPRYIIYEESEWPNGDGVSWLDRYPLIISYIFDHYHIEKVIGKTVLFAPGPPSSPVPDHLVVADLTQMPYLRAGWYYPEDYGGKPARWMAPAARALVTRRPHQREFYVVAYKASKPARHLQIKLNGVATAPLDLVGPDGWSLLHVPVPASVPVNRPIDVELSVDTPEPPTDNRLLAVSIAELGFTTQRALAERERAEAFASIQPRPRWAVRDVKVNDMPPAPVIAFSGSLEPAPGTPAINAIFVSVDGIAPAPVDALMPGARLSFAGRYALKDVPPGDHVLSFRGLAVDLSGTDTAHVPYSADYAQAVTVPSARPLPTKAVNALGHPTRTASYAFGIARTIDGSVTLRRGTAISVEAGDGVTISGWAVDPVSSNRGSGLVAILDGKHAWQVDYGIAEPDIVSAPRTPAARNSGFFARLPTTGLAIGQHQLAFVLVGANGHSYDLGAPLTLTVRNRPQDSWIDAIDGRSDFGTHMNKPVTVSRDQPLTVSGWAVDAAHRDVLGGVGIAIDGRLIGPANYGGTRSDVAATFHVPAYVPSGFTSALALDGISTGKHVVQILMRTKAGSMMLSHERRLLIVR